MGVTGPADCGLVYLVFDDVEFESTTPDEDNRATMVQQHPKPLDQG